MTGPAAAAALKQLNNCAKYIYKSSHPQHSDHSACMMTQKLDGVCHMSGNRLQSGARVSGHSGLTEEVD